MTKQAEFLQGYVFHYNPYTETWAGFPRECSNDYFNGVNNKDIIKHKNVNDIIEYLKISNTKVKRINDVEGD
jgi:hypothetical protein